MAKGYCPECDNDINLGRDPNKGQKVSCPSCGAYLEVVGLSPIELDWVFEDDEELEYEYEDEFDDYDDD